MPDLEHDDCCYCLHPFPDSHSWPVGAIYACGCGMIWVFRGWWLAYEDHRPRLDPERS